MTKEELLTIADKPRTGHLAPGIAVAWEKRTAWPVLTLPFVEGMPSPEHLILSTEKKE